MQLIFSFLKIELDGTDIQTVNPQWLRSSIGVVSQEPVLFGMSILDNILLGREDRTLQDAIIAAKLANAHGFISALPNVCMVI
jgi:ATP-binding cassette subfamily B (MDR/TAP) protein 1